MEDEKQKWLDAGDQTRATEYIQDFLDTNFAIENDFEFIFGILEWIRHNITGFDWDTDGIQNFRKRTAEEILKSKNSCGCSDHAVLFRGFMVARNLPSYYIEYFERDFLINELNNKFSGHVLVRINIKDHWYLVDPTTGAVTIGSIKSLIRGKEFVKYQEGFDSWDIGINDWYSYAKASLEFRDEWRNENSLINKPNSQ